MGEGRDHDPGDRRPTIKDVAREAGVSFKTVSRVLNGDRRVNAEMRAAVEAAQVGLGYRPHRAARSLRTSRTYAIALLAGSRDEPAAGARAPFPEYLGDIVAGCARACRPAGFHLVLELIAYGDRRQAAAVTSALLDDVGPDGVILIPPLCDLNWLIELLETRGIPFARVMPGIELDRGACFSAEDFDAARALTERLLAAGHRRLAHIAGPPDHLAARARREGFEAALAACPDARGVVGEGDFYLESGEREAMRLLSVPDRPTALFAANDGMAAGALKAAAALGLSVPDDLAVAGFDDSSVATLTTPPLTSIRQPTAELARHAAAALIAAAGRIERPAASILRLPCSIVERASARLQNTAFQGDRLP